MVAVTPVRSGEPYGRLFASGRVAFGGARLLNVRKTSEAQMVFLRHVIHYLAASAEAWRSAWLISEGGEALANVVGFAPPVILRLTTCSAAARRVQPANACCVRANRYALRIRFGHSGASPHQCP